MYMKKSKIAQNSLPVPCSLFPLPLPQRQFLTPTYLSTTYFYTEFYMWIIDDVISALVGEAVGKILNQVQYNETRLRLLNKFGLKPDTPPNDFDGVYVYTLIEYGVGKQKVILQLFKETEIKEEFRKAFNHNRSFNIQTLDNFIQSSDIGDKIKDQNIDYRRELTEFAMSLNYKEFPDRIRSCFSKEIQEQKDLDHWHYDMMGQTMLIRNADGDYYPAHRSLLEFFVSYKLGRELGILAADFQEVVEVLPYDQGKIDLSQTFGKTLLAKAVLDLMFPMLSTTANQRLLAEVKATKGKNETIAAYCGSNAVQLLLKGSRLALEKQDLSETAIKNVDFSRASLYNVNLTNANLKESVFATELTSVLAVAFSPDGKVLATGEQDGRVRLWNVITGKELLTFKRS